MPVARCQVTLVGGKGVFRLTIKESRFGCRSQTSNNAMGKKTKGTKAIFIYVATHTDCLKRKVKVFDFLR